ncbi:MULTISPECIES: Spy/CpxP family protein refolding chaperone [unclassified Vibrio]|uniref:Spy/CpxP family protein refolding chaperone n=1 Tax=Vibrio sp. HB236076 TaxID=3232307 RepID=A0AB39HE12_9VIBR|nr:Spy/CpxP family protein refolding chaperone [Vibrio sp. HB161653]MDP5255438.1 Spy/CpxP family protein refolding chaperone [Vibrio sp. HB161653]
MNKTKKLCLLGAMLPVVLTTSVFAHQANSKDEKKMMPRHEQCKKGGDERGIFKRLDLTEHQKAQLVKLRQQEKDAQKAQREEMKKQHNEIVMAERFDKSAAEEFAKQQAEQRINRQVQRLQHEFNVMHILNKDQQVLFMDMKHKQDEHCKPGMKQGKKPGMHKEHRGHQDRHHEHKPGAPEQAPQGDVPPPPPVDAE